eukprot:2143183-Rhodomonas_salina.1
MCDLSVCCSWLQRCRTHCHARRIWLRLATVCLLWRSLTPRLLRKRRPLKSLSRALQRTLQLEMFLPLLELACRQHSSAIPRMSLLPAFHEIWHQTNSSHLQGCRQRASRTVQQDLSRSSLVLMWRSAHHRTMLIVTSIQVEARPSQKLSGCHALQKWPCTAN